jgi:penicillin amidase
MRILLVLGAAWSLPSASLAAPPVSLPELHAAAEIVRDTSGIAHVRAKNEHDLFLLQGWLHAEDRLFQMDVTRRRASGTLAELLGPAALSGDVQLRTFGLRRAAERSLPLLSARARAAVEAYVEGVNAFVASHPLPPEYAALRLTRFSSWTALDTASVAKLIAFGLSFDLGDIDRTVALESYRRAGATLRFDGTKLFFQDLFRSAPFDPASTIPDALGPQPREAKGQVGREAGSSELHPRTVEMGKEFLDKVRAEPFLRQLLNHDDRAGSNQWAIAGALTDTGFPMLASDPHLALGVPSTLYPIHLRTGRFDAIGNSFPGAPFVVVGHNRHIAWGATVNPLDVTDVFQERLVPDSSSPSGLSTVFQGRNEPVIPIPESYRVNQISDGLLDQVVPVPPGPSIPPATLVVPRRNGPLVQLDLAQGVGLSVQFTGFYGTREAETFLAFDTARDLAEFRQGLPLFDFGSQNFVYADTVGNIAYFTGSAVPIREDLQRGSVAGLPPYFIRNGTGGNEWLPVQHPQPGQVVPFEILPLEEMPQIANPPAGFLINANNDPIGITLGNDPLSRRRPGGGIYYLSPGYDFGNRAGRITRRVREQLAREPMSFEVMQSIQADVKLLDAEVFVPVITAAFSRARRDGAPLPLAALAASPEVAEAVGRLARWDTSTPTGIPEGFDASDNRSFEQDGGNSSVAATLYSVWRGQFIRNVIDAHLGPLPKPPGQQAMTALRNLIDRFAEQHGVGASGLDFFSIPGLSLPPEDRRDILVLQSLRGALDRLAGAPFATAFNHSTNQDDYRWGKLHRITFAHPMGGPFSVPSAFGLFPHPIAPLLGIPTDGGFGVVDASAHDPRADSENSFMFGGGPSNRLVVSLDAEDLRAESVWPGGVSALPSSPFYLNLLPLWLRNETVPLLTRPRDLARSTASVTHFVP